MRPPRLRCALFPLINPPHLLVLPATFGLHLILQTYPYFRALYVIPVRRTKSLLTASFRFHLAMDTLAVRLYTSSLPRRVRDLHPLERAHGAQTKTRPTHVVDLACSSCIILHMLRPLSRCNDLKKNALSLFPGTISSLKTKYRKMRRLGTRINPNDSRLLLQCYTLPSC